MKSLSCTCFPFPVFLPIIYAWSSISAFKQFILCLRHHQQVRKFFIHWETQNDVNDVTTHTKQSDLHNKWNPKSLKVQPLSCGHQQRTAHLIVTESNSKLKNDWSCNDNIPSCCIHIVEFVKCFIKAVVANQKIINVSNLARWLTAFHLFW